MVIWLPWLGRDLVRQPALIQAQVQIRAQSPKLDFSEAFITRRPALSIFKERATRREVYYASAGKRIAPDLHDGVFYQFGELYRVEAAHCKPNV